MTDEWEECFMKKRIASSLTALALCLSLLPGTAWAATHAQTLRYRH